MSKPKLIMREKPKPKLIMKAKKMLPRTGKYAKAMGKKKNYS